MVYFIQEHKNPKGLIKIGQSENVRERLENLQIGSPVLLQVLKVMPAEEYEARIHARFAKFWVRGEWFSPSKDLMDFIGDLPSSEHDGYIAAFKECLSIRYRRSLLKPTKPIVLQTEDSIISSLLSAKRQLRLSRIEKVK